MYTCYQTAVVTFPNTLMKFTTLENIPLLPAHINAGEKGIRIETYAYTTTWGKDGVVTRVYKDGVTKTWWRKPTLKDAITLKDTGIFIQFHKSGEVTARYNGINYYWSENRFLEPFDSLEMYAGGGLFDYNE